MGLPNQRGKITSEFTWQPCPPLGRGGQVSFTTISLTMFKYLRYLLACLFILNSSIAGFPQLDDDEEDELLFELSPFSIASPTMGATVGGAQDIRYFRDQVRLGNVPHPNTLTAEGLLSEHDLPLAQIPDCQTVFCVGGEAIRVDLIGEENTRYLAQLGLTSGLDPGTWTRQPLNLIAVVDKSGSMNGHPLDLVRKSLREVLNQLSEQDQLAIVLYGDRSYVHLAPTSASPGNRSRILSAIETIQSAGSTYMEAGLKVGYDLAQESSEDFEGQTRLMLFTDERPNVGKTDAGSFMGMAYAGSKSGFGLTTIGVGVQFGAELATKISNVRGGNLFFFADEEEMKKLFGEEFDTIVTELAYDLDLRVTPLKGLQITGVYGIPGEMLEWVDDNSLRMSIATIFLSVKQGGIYFAFGPEDNNLPAARAGPGDSVGSVRLSYTTASGEKEQSSADFVLLKEGKEGAGLSRGSLLINEYLALKKAGIAHYQDNDQETAFQAVHSVTNLFRKEEDTALASEMELLAKLELTLALLSGHLGEVNIPESFENEIPRALWGVWRITDTRQNQMGLEKKDVMAFWPAGGVSLFNRRKGHDFPVSEFQFERSGRNQFKLLYPELDGTKDEVEERIDVSFEVKGDRLELKMKGGGLLELRKSELKLKGDEKGLDPVTGLPGS